jgi:16S rRNA G966 N2-methylase RsmD
MLFLDPPYASDLAEATLEALAEVQLLAAHGMVIWQHAARHRVPDVVLGRPCGWRRRYGVTQLSLYAPQDNKAPALSCGAASASAEDVGRREGD